MRIIVGNNNHSAAVLLQNGEDVLEEVELFVTRARREGVAMNGLGSAGSGAISVKC
jgi:hypothetical protein